MDFPSSHTPKTYLYQFSHVAPDKPYFPNYGAFHTSEVPFALHTLHQWDRPWRPVNKEVENTMSTYWVNFAKTGNPNGNKLPDWKSYDQQAGNIMVLSDKTLLQPGLFRQEFRFLDGGF